MKYTNIPLFGTLGLLSPSSLIHIFNFVNSPRDRGHTFCSYIHIRHLMAHLEMILFCSASGGLWRQRSVTFNFAPYLVMNMQMCFFLPYNSATVSFFSPFWSHIWKMRQLDITLYTLKLRWTAARYEFWVKKETIFLSFSDIFWSKMHILNLVFQPEESHIFSKKLPLV